MVHWLRLYVPNAGDPGLILGFGDPLEKGMATLLFLDNEESDMTEQLTLSL